MLKPSRRGFLTAGAALPVAAAMARVPEDHLAKVAADLETYIGFGIKRAGGVGDNACGEWLAGELEQLGFRIERQDVSVPWFEAERCDLVSGPVKAAVWPQPIVVQTGAGGVTGPLVRIDTNQQVDGELNGAIALLELPYARWSTAMAKPFRGPVAAAYAAGAKAVIAITNGPTGKIIALNADGREPMFPVPVALLAPEDARPFLAAAMAGESATLTVTGKAGRRPAFNFIGRIDRGKKKWLAVSTPRSGWYTCAGERGPGVAAWLWLARWASKAVTGYNLAFVCNTGHEYENLGAAEALKATAPAPADTHFWLHLGANVASRDWHDLTGQPLPSVDTQRFLSVRPELVPLARAIFEGQAGLETPYTTDKLNAGELIEIVAAGYKNVAGVFGLHRYHHTDGDDARCVHAPLVASTAAAFQALVERVIR